MNPVRDKTSKMSADPLLPRAGRVSNGMNLRWLLVALVLSGAVAILNHLAGVYDWYFYSQGFDRFIHLLGGIAIATFVVGMFPVRRSIIFITLCVLVFVGWEIFEYVAKLPQPANYALDTELDLLMDTLGAIVVYVFARKTIWFTP